MESEQTGQTAVISPLKIKAATVIVGGVQAIAMTVMFIVGVMAFTLLLKLLWGIELSIVATILLAVVVIIAVVLLTVINNYCVKILSATREDEARQEFAQSLEKFKEHCIQQAGSNQPAEGRKCS